MRYFKFLKGIFMSLKIGFIGSPGSGKSVLAGLFLAELLQRGHNGTRLVTEVATEFLGQGHEITLDAQRTITERQITREDYNDKCHFNPILCDSVGYFGFVYREFHLEKNHVSRREYDRTMNYIQDTKDKYLKRYPITIYSPLFDDTSKLGKFRIHGSEDSEKIDKIIRKMLDSTDSRVFKAPNKVEERSLFVRETCAIIEQEYLKKK